MLNYQRVPPIPMAHHIFGRNIPQKAVSICWFYSLLSRLTKVLRQNIQTQQLLPSLDNIIHNITYIYTYLDSYTQLNLKIPHMSTSLSVSLSCLSRRSPLRKRRDSAETSPLFPESEASRAEKTGSATKLLHLSWGGRQSVDPAVIHVPLDVASHVALYSVLIYMESHFFSPRKIETLKIPLFS